MISDLLALQTDLRSNADALENALVPGSPIDRLFAALQVQLAEVDELLDTLIAAG